MPPRNTDELIRQVDQGDPVKYVYFWGHKSRGSRVDETCLSQWYPSPFRVYSRRFATAEHFMMFRKAEVFGDRGIAAKVLDAQSPGEAKALGRQVQGFDVPTWLEFRWDIVVEANVAKFSQNAALQQYLLGTGERVLVEASPVDAIWGIGMDKAAAMHVHPKDWQGENLLGFALMEARERVRQGAA
ncbi:MAG: NADAR family protein [Pseudomonadota bacterium]